MQSSTPLCLFTGQVEKQNGEYVLTIPDQEIDLGTLQPDETYRIGVYATASAPSGTGDHQPAPTAENANNPTHRSTPSRDRDSPQTASNPGRSNTSPDSHSDQPPVSEGETLQVEIESLGEQGDGLAKVGPGYVVFVPDTEVGQQPLVRITAARENVAFAEVVDP
jgi:predicted RNA-binding protein with TRAM domain